MMTVQAANAAEQLVLDFFVVLSSGDLETLRGFYREASVWEPKVKDIPGAGRHVGMAIIDEFLAPVRGMFKPGDPKVHVQAMFSQTKDGTTWVCVESNSTGESMDGKVYDNDYCWVFEISNGKIDAMREYMDSLYTAKWFGMV
ncbi:nuclear transport factor 2 family protein [Alteraurantiacibacter palmitatis]|uniref:Nuclear transport factor 2 family protein n=1 Tax=Alteraurantiacibacter palmitatis TaxID=2054628 RepID=A0ABV7E9R9_9SPHN